MATKPDLKMTYTPTGWSAPVVVSKSPTSMTTATSITTGDSLYLSWAALCDGSYADVPGTFYTAVYVDDVYLTRWSTSDLLAGYYTHVDGYSLGKFSVGTHRIKVVTDYTGLVSEVNESNNAYTTSFTVSQSSSSVYSDSYENDNSRFKAKTISVGQTQSRSIHTGSDEDWLKFTVASDGFYSIVTSGGDTILDFYTMEGQYCGSNDDRGNGNLGSFSVMQLYANTSYYVRVRSYGSKTFNYTVSLTSGVVADTFESNSDGSRTTTTTSLSAGSSQWHTLHSASDVDWIKVNITTAGSYALTVSTGDRDANKTRLEVYDSSGTRLAYMEGLNPYCYGDLDVGIYYMKVTSASGVAAGSYLAAVSKNDTSDTSFDAYEVDDYSYLAREITLSSSQTSVTQNRSLTIYTTDSGTVIPDTDWVKFTPTVTGLYRFSVSGTSAATKMTLYTSADTDDKLLIPVGGDTQFNPYVENYLVAGMTYYLSVEDKFTRLNIPSYNLTLERKSAYTAEADSYESDNTRSSAKALTLGDAQAHSLHTATDQDWMKFTPTVSDYYTFYTGARNGNAGDGDLMLGLYDSSGKLLACDDDSGAGYNAMVTYSLSAGSTYYLVALSARDNQVVPFYTVTAARGVIEDGYDIYMDERSTNDNTRANAIPIAVGSNLAHTIHSSSDVDWVRINVDTAGYYTLETSGSGDTIINFYDANGNFLQLDDDGGVGRNARITRYLSANTNYYAKVSAYNGTLVPLYNLALAKSSGGSGDAYENDDTRANAHAIVAGETQSHTIHSSTDVDWTVIRPIQRGTYQIQTSGDGDMKLELYNAAGQLLASDDDSGVGLNARVGQVLNANTDYYIKAYAYNGALVENYGLSVALMVGSELGDEYENDDNPSLAKSIAVGQTQSHSIHIAGDVDWVTFTPTVSAEYTIQTVGSGLNCDTQLYIYTSLANAQSGNYLQWDDDSGADRNALISRVLTAGTKYYIKAKAWSDYTIPSYGLKVTQNNGTGSNNEVNGDEYESDNFSGDCKPIAVGREYTHSIHTQSDTDWVRFYTHQSGTYTIQTTGDADMSFIVYRRIPGGALVPYEGGSEITTGGGRDNALYTTRLEANNWYYVRLTTTNRKTTASSYGVRVDLNPTTVRGDAYETAGGKSDDNAPSRATWITPNSVQLHSIHAGGDVDYYAIKVSSTGDYTIASDRNDLYIYAYRQNANGTQTFLERYEPMGTETAHTLTLNANTTYYFKVAALTNLRTIDSYQFSISNPRDAYEDDDTSAKATVLNIGSSQSHTLHMGQDVDWVTFTISSSQAGKYILENDNSSSVKMILYRNQSGSNTVVGESTSTKSYSLSAGTYYVRASSANGRVNEGYTIGLKKDTSIAADSYESDNSRSSAAQLSMGTSGKQTHTLHTSSDVDYVKFYGTAGNRYTIKTAGGNVALEIQNSSGSVMSRGNGVSASAYIDVTSSGYYYAKVSSGTSAAVESYTIQGESASLNKAENYVVLFNGGASKTGNFERYFCILRDVYNTLVENGVPADHIYILNSDGLSSSPDMNKGSRQNPIMANTDWSFATRQGTSVKSATLDNLKTVINQIDSKMDSNDHFLMLTSDHGYSDSHDLAAWEDANGYSTWITPSQMNSAVSCLTTGYQTYLFAECFSGHMLDGLSVSSSYGTRFGMASAAETESSYSSTSTGFGYDFLAAFEHYGMSMTTDQMSSYMMSNGTYVCHNSHSDNQECSSHKRDTAAGYNTGYQHPWDKGSNFQIFAQA